MPSATSARRGCVGASARFLRLHRVGIRKRPAILPGAPSCSAPAISPPENGACAMTEMSSPPGRRRILSIWLARLAIDHWRLAEGLAPGEGADAEPLALLAETAHGPRIAAANAAGLEAGARPGMMLADARALCPGLAVAPSDPARNLAFLETLALWAQRWGPWSALDPPDGMIVDITGVAHLFGGERALIADAAQRLAARGLAARLAIAPTAGAAWALAHYGPEHAILESGGHLDDLPVAALRLDPAT